MAAESYFTNAVNEVLEASERIVGAMEDGISVLMTGGLPQQAKQGAAESSMGGEFELDEDALADEDLADEDLMMDSPLQGIANSVLGDIISGQAGPQTPMDHFNAFKSVIRWTEPFVISLIVFQVFMLLLCLWVSRRNGGTAPRLIVMVLIAIIVRSSEWLNRLGEQHWQRFATQDYFDKGGVFLAIMLSGPLLLDCLFMLLLFVREASQLLVQVKKQEIAKKKKASKQTKEGKDGKNETRKKMDKND